MDAMSSLFPGKFILLLAFLLTAFLCPSASAQSPEEMSVLQMYYKPQELVVTPTRNPLPISRVADNITVVTAEQIRAMNAHTVADVLNRIPGLFVSFSQELGATPLISIQGSEDWHVLVMLDGIAWNFLSNGIVVTNTIPVGIIERIEVVQGPASSVWGSSLGGVINIITKPAGDTIIPEIFGRASVGEKRTQDYRAQIAGRIGPLGYYLFGGRQESDGLRDERYFDGYNLYSKWVARLSERVEAGASIGYTDTDVGQGSFPSAGISSTWKGRTFFATGCLDVRLPWELQANASFYYLRKEYEPRNTVLGSGAYGQNGSLFMETAYGEDTLGGNLKITWAHKIQTVVLGVDYEFGRLNTTQYAGTYYQFFRVPAISRNRSDINRVAVYANDNIIIGRWSVTPGLRFDYNSITGSFISPSLGVTCRVREDTILRASASRGFTSPPLDWTSNGGLFLDPNPSLKSEEVWSVQAGAESTALKYVRVRANLFFHDLRNAMKSVPSEGKGPSFNYIFINAGRVRRPGVELVAETVPLYDFSLWAGFSYVQIRPSGDAEDTERYTYNIGLRYDNPKWFRAELFGHYIWWNLPSDYDGKYDDFIWEFNINRSFEIREGLTADLFFTAHNLFNGSQYSVGDTKNPKRWVEGGVRIFFD
jgi:vitamin B12 transporter